jgi:hypothetical protein
LSFSTNAVGPRIDAHEEREYRICKINAIKIKNPEKWD